MSRELHFYADTTTGTGERKRLWIRPGYDSTRSLGTVPDHGDTTGNSGWKPCPEGFFKEQSTGEYGYDALPVGHPDPPTRGFRVDLLTLYESGDSDLESLAEYLATDATLTGSYSISGALTGPCEKTNVFTVLTDDGDATKAITAFRTEFIGCHERSIMQPLEVGPAEIIAEIHALDLLRVALTQLTPQALYYHISTSSYGETEAPIIYSAAYTSGGVDYIHAFGDLDSVTARQVHVIYSIADLWTAIATLTQNMLRALTADSTFAFGISIAGTDIPTDHGTTGMLVLYDQDYTAANTAGTTDLIDTSGVHFVGRIYLADDTDTDVGGWLHSGSDEGLHRFATLWDALKVAVEGHAARTRFSTYSGGAIGLTFEPLENNVSSDVTVYEGKYPLRLRDGIIAGAEAEFPDATGNDVPTVQYRAWGTDDDSLRTIPTWFHCQPFVGEEGEIKSTGETIRIFGDTGWEDFGGDVVGVLQKTWPVNTLVYFDTPTGASGDVPIRCHHRVQVRTGDSLGTLTDDCINGVALPTPDPGDAPGVEQYQNEWIRDSWWRPYRIAAITAQANGGIPLAVTQYVGGLFSRWTQYGTTLIVPTSEAGIIRLGTLPNLDIVANWIPAGVGIFDGLTGDPFIVKGSDDEAKGETTLTLIAPGGA